MNRFTNKNGGILPFQMVKLAAKNPLPEVLDRGRKVVQNAAASADSNVKVTVNNGSGISDGLPEAVNNVGEQLRKHHNYSRDRLGEIRRLIKGSKEEVREAIEELRKAGVDPEKIDELLKLSRNGATSAQLDEAFGRIAADIQSVNRRIPGAVKLTGAVVGGNAIWEGGKSLYQNYTSDNANNAHAAGATAAQQGQLAAKQNGQGGGWWDRTWNDINKFREENPGWFYGGLGVGLLGGGYALSEMLDDDDEDEEDEYRRY